MIPLTVYCAEGPGVFWDGPRRSVSPTPTPSFSAVAPETRTWVGVVGNAPCSGAAGDRDVSLGRSPSHVVPDPSGPALVPAGTVALMCGAHACSTPGSCSIFRSCSGDASTGACSSFGLSTTASALRNGAAAVAAMLAESVLASPRAAVTNAADTATHTTTSA